MTRQLIADEKFTNIQRAQAGLTKLFEEAKKSMSFYRVLKNDTPLGVLLPQAMWESMVEDIEALSSDTYKKEIAEARRDKKRYTLAEVKKRFGL